MPGNIFTTNNVIVGYSPNDFFYYQAQHENLMPKNDVVFDASCAQLRIDAPTWDVSCSQTYFTDNSYNCIAKELCRNKKKVNKLAEMQTVHSGSDEKYLDTTHVYSNGIRDAANLGVGILLLFVLILRNRNV